MKRVCVAALVPLGLIMATIGGGRAHADPVECGGPWGTRVQGSPAGFDSGDRGGDYLWHDDSGFHLRVTHRTAALDVYAGTITSPRPMHIAPVALEAGDRADLSPDNRVLWFAFANHGHIDGVDFVTDCADQLTVGPLTTDNLPLPSDRIHLGANGVAPERNPFTVSRQGW